MEFLKEKNVQRLRDIRRMQCGRQLRIVPVNGHDEYYKGGTANNFALCTEKDFCTEGFLNVLQM